MGSFSSAAIAVIAMFLPSFLLVVGTLPFWAMIRTKPRIQAVLKGVNAPVVGILLASLYDPVFTSAVHESIEVVIVLISFTLLVFYKLSPWLVVVITTVLGALSSAKFG